MNLKAFFSNSIYKSFLLPCTGMIHRPPLESLHRMYTSQRVEGLIPLACGDNSQDGALDSSQAVLFPTPAVPPVLGSPHASSHFTFLSYANLPPSCREPGLNLWSVTRLDPIVLQGQLHGQDLSKPLNLSTADLVVFRDQPGGW